MKPKKLSRLDNVILCWLFLLYTFYWLMWLIWTHWKTQFGQTLVPPEVCTIAVLFGEMGLGKVSVPIMSLGFLPQLSYVSWMFPKWPRWKKTVVKFVDLIISYAVYPLISHFISDLYPLRIWKEFDLQISMVHVCPCSGPLFFLLKGP